MKGVSRLFTGLSVAALAASSIAAYAEDSLSLGPVEAMSIAVDAYIYGYPLVTFDTVRKQQTNVAKPDAEHAPMGQMIKMRSYPAVDNHCCAAPNADTLYTEVWLDVSKEPWIFGIPDMGERYYIMPMLDGWSEVFEVAGSRTTGGKAQTYAITGPGWSGTLPPGVKEVKSPTGMVWILGRIYSNGTPEDYKAVHALQDKFTVVPLSAYGKPYTPPPGVVDPKFDMKTAVRKQVNAMDIVTYFKRLAQLMKTNPPTAQDAPMVARMARIGLVPGQDFDPSKLDFLDREVIRTVPKLALVDMGRAAQGDEDHQRLALLHQGRGQLRHRLPAARHGQPARPRLEPRAGRRVSAVAEGREGRCLRRRQVQVRGALREGAAAAGRGVLVADDVRRRLLLRAESDPSLRPRQRDKLVANPDGSVDMYLQAASPGKDKEANWLPAPKGKFKLVMRIYSPTGTPPSILDGSWTPPPVKRVP